MVSWKDAAERNESVASAALVIPKRICLPLASFLPSERIAGVLQFNFMEHLTHDDFDVLVVNFNTLRFVYFLYFVDEVTLGRLDAEYMQNVVRVDRAFGQAVAFGDGVAVFDHDFQAVRNGFGPFFAAVGNVDFLDLFIFFQRFDLHGAADFRDNRVAFRFTRFEKFFNTRQTLRDIFVRRDAAGVE